MGCGVIAIQGAVLGFWHHTSDNHLTHAWLQAFPTHRRNPQSLSLHTWFQWKSLGGDSARLLYEEDQANTWELDEVEKGKSRCMAGVTMANCKSEHQKLQTLPRAKGRREFRSGVQALPRSAHASLVFPISVSPLCH